MNPLDLESLPLRIHPMTLGHVPAVAAIEKATFGSPWPESAFVQELTRNPYAAYLVLEYAPRVGRRVLTLPRILNKKPIQPIVIGYGGYWQMVDEAHICTLAVREDWRERGLGELVLLSLIRPAMSLNIDRLSLEVRASNRVAQSLYTKYGFEIVGDRPGYYSDNHEDALIMTTPDVHTAPYAHTIERLSQELLERLNRQRLEPIVVGNTFHSEKRNDGHD